MDQFTSSLEKSELTYTVIIGATFGLFLTIGQSWAAFFHAIAMYLVPPTYDILQELVYAGITSSVCTILICVVFRIKSCTNYVVKKSKISIKEMMHKKNKDLRPVRRSSLK